jgi:hypothetical protein
MDAERVEARCAGTQASLWDHRRVGTPDVKTDRPQDTGRQASRRPRRKRTQELRERRDAAFAPKRRGRPKGTRLSFFEDKGRFAIAMVYSGEVFMGLTRYSAAYGSIALLSKRPINARSVAGILTHLCGGPSNATLKGKAQALVAKCEHPRTIREAEWIASSAALLGFLINQHRSNPSRLKAVFDGLNALGWAPVLLEIARKIGAVGASNQPPIDEPVSARVRALLVSLASKPKS